MQSSTSTKSSRTWSLLLKLGPLVGGRALEASAEIGLTPPQAHLLELLARGGPEPMGALAAELRCDPSNVTGLIGRLEARGLVAREASADDARVRHVRLTAEGRRLARRFARRLHEVPPALDALSPSDHRELQRLLTLLLRQEEPDE